MRVLALNKVYVTNKYVVDRDQGQEHRSGVEFSELAMNSHMMSASSTAKYAHYYP